MQSHAPIFIHADWQSHAISHDNMRVNFYRAKPCSDIIHADWQSHAFSHDNLCAQIYRAKPCSDLIYARADEAIPCHQPRYFTSRLFGKAMRKTNS